MRKLFALLVAALTLGAFALPAAADDDKSYTLQMSTSPPTYPSPPLVRGSLGVSLTARLTNVTEGNSTIKSFKLFAPSGVIIKTATVPAGFTANAQVQPGGGAVYVDSINLPIKRSGPAFPLALTVDVTCDATGGNWTTVQSGKQQVWTGTGFTGQNFSIKSSSSSVGTGVTGACATYTITPANTPNVNSGSGSVSLTFNNTSPTGGASIGSLSITAPTNFTITGGTTSNGGLVTPSGSTATFTGGAAVGPGSSLTLSLDVTTPNCNGAAAAPWSAAQVYANSNLTGQAFSGPGTYPSTGITALACSATIVNQPATTFAGAPIRTTAYNNPQGDPVTVSLVINGVAPPDSPPTVVTLSLHAGTCSISNASANAVGGVATFTNFSSAVGAGCKLGASGGGVNSTVDSVSFDIVGKQGDLTCDEGGAAGAPKVGALDPLSPDTPASTGDPSNDYGMVRGLNLNGHCGDAVPFSFSYDPDNHSVVLTEDSLDQHTSVEYVVLWTPVPIDDDGWAGKQPCVSWGAPNSPPVWTPDALYGCTGDYAPALFCLSDNVDGGDAVMPTIPNSAPYNLAGTETQYQYGTDPATLAPRKAKVCVVQQGTISAGVVGGVQQVQYFTRIIDQSDSGVRLP